MLKQLFANLKFHKQIPFVILVFFQFELLVTSFVVGVIGDETTWLPLAGMLALIGVMLYLIFSVPDYHQSFMLALSMGCTRREFMILDAAEKLIWIVLSYLCIIMVCLFEELLYCRVPGEFIFIPILTDWRVFLTCIAVMVILPMFLGALYSRFGWRLRIVLYFIWLILILILPRLESHWNLSLLEKMPVLGWIVLGIGALAAMLITTVKLGMKQAVR